MPPLLIFSAALLPSWVVTNNLYVNDPTPLGKGNGEFFPSIATGIKPKIDSVSNNQSVNFSNKISTAPILSFFVPVLSLGVRIHNVYLESGAIFYNKLLCSHFGIAEIISSDKTKVRL